MATTRDRALASFAIRNAQPCQGWGPGFEPLRPLQHFQTMQYITVSAAKAALLAFALDTTKTPRCSRVSRPLSARDEKPNQSVNAMTPDLGQGACQVLHDAVVLAYLLGCCSL